MSDELLRTTFKKMQRGAVLLLIVSLCAVTTPLIADAFPADKFGRCASGEVSWAFSKWDKSVPWTATNMTRFRGAVEDLDNARSYNGNQLINFREVPTSGNPDVKVYVVRWPGNVTHGGAAGCRIGKEWVQINLTAIGSDATAFELAAKHEMLHTVGAKHSGLFDSRNGDGAPLMATCVGKSHTTFTQDDAAYMQYLHSPLPFSQLTANLGFENRRSYWGYTNGALYWHNLGGATGPGHGKFFASGTWASSYIYSSTRVWTGHRDVSARAKFNVRSRAGADETKARVRLYRQEIFDGAHNECTTGQFALGLRNLNATSANRGYIYVAGYKIGNVQTPWTAYETGWRDLPDADGWQLQVRAYGHSNNPNGTRGSVRFDNVRAELKDASPSDPNAYELEGEGSTSVSTATPRSAARSETFGSCGAGDYGFASPQKYLRQVDSWVEVGVDASAATLHDEYNLDPSTLAGVMAARDSGSTVTFALTAEGARSDVLFAVAEDVDGSVFFPGFCQHKALFLPLSNSLGGAFEETVTDAIGRVGSDLVASLGLGKLEEDVEYQEVPSELIMNPEVTPGHVLDKLRFATVNIQLGVSYGANFTICTKSPAGWNDCFVPDAFTAAHGVDVDAYLDDTGQLEVWLLDEVADLSAPLKRLGTLNVPSSPRTAEEVAVRLRIGADSGSGGSGLAGNEVELLDAVPISEMAWSTGSVSEPAEGP